MVSGNITNVVRKHQGLWEGEITEIIWGMKDQDIAQHVDRLVAHGESFGVVLNDWFKSCRDVAQLQ